MWLAAALLCMACPAAKSQSHTVRFEENAPWVRVTERAMALGRLIFVDCRSAAGAQPAAVYDTDAVAALFNDRFVCVRYDMDNPEALKIAKKFGVAEFPTLLFIDSASQRDANRIVGSLSAEELLGQAEAALDPGGNTIALLARFEAGDHDPLLVDSLLCRLCMGRQRDRGQQVACMVLENLPEEGFVNLRGWDIFEAHVHDPLCKATRRMLERRQAFCEITCREEIDDKFYRCIHAEVVALSSWTPKAGPFNAQRNKALKTLLESAPLPFAAGELAWLAMADLAREGNYKGMLDAMRRIDDEGSLEGPRWTAFFIANIEKLACSGDLGLLKEGIAWIDLQTDSAADPAAKSSLCRSKAVLCAAAGDSAAAARAAARAEEYLQLALNP